MTAQPTDHTTLPQGTILEGRWSLGQKIGSGGFATVYEGHHLKLERDVAIKVLEAQAPPGTFEVFQERFLREAKLSAKLDHPNVVQILDFGFVNHHGSPKPFIVMERLRGHDLEDELLNNGSLHPLRAQQLFDPALAALAESHQKGIVHRDLKPSNLFLSATGTEQERMVVLDFGIARAFDDPSSKLTATNHYTGTPAYLAPEYIETQQSSPAVDVYQMGLIIGEALSGQPIVQASSPLAYLMAHCNGQQRLPDFLLGTPLGDVLAKAISVDPQARYADAEALRQALRQVSWNIDTPTQAHAPVAVLQPTLDHPPQVYSTTQKHAQEQHTQAPPQSQRDAKRLAPVLIALAVVLVALGGVAAFLGYQHLNKKTPVEAPIVAQKTTPQTPPVADTPPEAPTQATEEKQDKAPEPPTIALNTSDTPKAKTKEEKPTGLKRSKTNRTSKTKKAKTSKPAVASNPLANAQTAPSQQLSTDPTLMLKPTSMDRKMGRIRFSMKNIATEPQLHYAGIKRRIDEDGMDDVLKVSSYFADYARGYNGAAGELKRLASTSPRNSALDSAAKKHASALKRLAQISEKGYQFRLKRETSQTQLKRIVKELDKTMTLLNRTQKNFMVKYFDAQETYLRKQMSHAKKHNGKLAYAVAAALYHHTRAVKAAYFNPTDAAAMSEYRKAVALAGRFKSSMDMKKMYPEMPAKMRNALHSTLRSIKSAKNHFTGINKAVKSKGMYSKAQHAQKLASAKNYLIGAYGIAMRNYHKRTF